MSWARRKRPFAEELISPTSWIMCESCAPPARAKNNRIWSLGCVCVCAWKKHFSEAALEAVAGVVEVMAVCIAKAFIAAGIGVVPDSLAVRRNIVIAKVSSEERFYTPPPPGSDFETATVPNIRQKLLSTTPSGWWWWWCIESVFRLFACFYTMH